MDDLVTSAVDGQLWYPRLEDQPSTIEVTLYDVRAADSLVIGYDYDRDGWTIARSENPEHEVAFVSAWPDPCGLGPCSGFDGHPGTCEEASGA